MKTINNVYLKFVFFNGLIVALTKLFGLSIPTSPINIITVIFLPLFIFEFIRSKKSSAKTLITFFLMYQVFKLVIYQYFNVTDVFNTLHDILAFTSFYYFYYLEQKLKLKQLLLIRTFSYFFFIVFIIQYFFKDILPVAFTEIPNLFNEYGVDRYTILVDDKNLYRPNGLIGNPITFGFVLNILLVIEYFFLNVSKTKTKSRIIITLLLLMISLLFSRANIVLAIATSFLYLAGTKRNSIKFFIVLLVFTLFAGTIDNLLYSNLTEYKHISDRLTGKNIRAQASTEEHVSDYVTAYNTFLENPFFGMSSKEITDNDIITDGAIPILILRHGFLGFIVLFIMYFSVLKFYKKDTINSKINYPFFIFGLMLLPYCIINSAILNKAVYLIVFALFGITINLSFKNLKQ